MNVPRLQFSHQEDRSLSFGVVIAFVSPVILQLHEFVFFHCSLNLQQRHLKLNIFLERP